MRPRIDPAGGVSRASDDLTSFRFGLTTATPPFSGASAPRMLCCRWFAGLGVHPVCGKETSVKTLAILLIVMGIIIVVWGAFGFQTRDKVLDIGKHVMNPSGV